MTILKRRTDWRAQLERVIDEIKRQPFQWGKMDCGPAFTGRVVQALTGVDLCLAHSGRYDDAESAYRLMRGLGFVDLADVVASLLPEHEHPARASLGDIAAIPTDTAFKHALGVVNGERILVLTERGLGTVSLLDAARAFKVG